jgi:hypothetical protein
MVRVNRLLVLVAACGLAACDQMGTEPTLSAPTGMGRNNDNGAQFEPTPFPGLGSFVDAETGRSCTIDWGTTQLDKNDFLKTQKSGDQMLHVSSQDAGVHVEDENGEIWDGVGTSAGVVRLSQSGGFGHLYFTATAKVTSLTGLEGQAVCHVMVEDNVFTKTDIDVR